jgi:hypothetical protein
MFIGAAGLSTPYARTKDTWMFLPAGVILMILGIWWARRTSPTVVESPSPSKGTLAGAVFNHRQHLTWQQSLGALVGLIGFSVVIIAVIAYSTPGASSTSVASIPLPTIYNCGEPIVIEECTPETRISASCKIRNVAQVSLGRNFGAWGYDSQGTRVGNPTLQTELNGLPPGQAVKFSLMFENTGDAVKTVILCSVDPNSQVGHRRLGIGQSPLQ